MHPIIPGSPLWGQSSEGLAGGDAELLVVLRATDDASQGSIHARSSYKVDEMVWNARFLPIHSTDAAGHLRADVARLSHIAPAEPPARGGPGEGSAPQISEPV